MAVRVRPQPIVLRPAGRWPEDNLCLFWLLITPGSSFFFVLLKSRLNRSIVALIRVSSPTRDRMDMPKGLKWYDTLPKTNIPLE